MRARALLTMTSVLAALAVCADGAMAQGLAGNGGAAYGGLVPSAGTRVTTQADPGEAGAVSPTAPAAVAGSVATIGSDGRAAPPLDAPVEVQEAILAANAIVGKPYKWGGGHRRFKDRGYDCSGAVSFALNGGDLLDSPLDSRGFFSWGESGEGEWITVYTKSSHAFVVIAGLRLDTSAAGDPSGAKGPRWRPVLRSTRGFRARHPEGL